MDDHEPPEHNDDDLVLTPILFLSIIQVCHLSTTPIPIIVLKVCVLQLHFQSCVLLVEVITLLGLTNQLWDYYSWESPGIFELVLDF